MWEALSAKDLKDCLLLLKAHSISEKTEKECIDALQIAKLLSQDWGFYYTATTNLKKIKIFLAEIDKLGPQANIDPKQIKKEYGEEITQKIDKMLEIIERAKSFGWKMRAKIGTKKKWYNPVERPETVGGFGIWETLLKRES